MCTQLGDEGLFGHGAGLLAALGVDVLRHLGAEGALALGVGGAVFVTVAAVYFKLDGQLPDGPGLDGLGKAGVLSQFQRRQAEELRPRPEALGPVDRQKFKIRVGDGLQIVFFHQLGEQRRETLQNRPIDCRRQQVVLVLRGVRGRLFGLHRRFQLFCCGGKDHPAVTGFCHAKMFEFHFLLPPLSGRCRPSAPAARCPARRTAPLHPGRTCRPRRTSRRGRRGYNKG